MNIELTVDRFEGEFAILKTNNDRIISWPKDKLPPEIKEKQMVYFYISEKNIKQEKAKDILNEILNN